MSVGCWSYVIGFRSMSERLTLQSIAQLYITEIFAVLSSTFCSLCGSFLARRAKNEPHRLPFDCAQDERQHNTPHPHVCGFLHRAQKTAHQQRKYCSAEG